MIEKSNKRTIPHNRPTVGEEEIKATEEALSNLELTMGTKVKEFEDDFTKFLGTNAVATSSGTSALHLSLQVLGIQERDQVILPTYTCVSVAYPVLYQRATPVLVDVSTDSNINPEEVQNNINEKTKAVIVPHMFGYPADIKPIEKICRENNISLIEDCAQSIGATYGGEMVGTFGDISIFSFYATKMITSIQGGMVCSKNKGLINDIKQLLDCEGDPADDRIKFRYSMSDVNAAVGIAQLKKLNKFITKRREIASIYSEKLGRANLAIPVEEKGRKHVYHRYIVSCNFNPNIIIKKLCDRGIKAAKMHYPPLHRRKLLKDYCNGDFPVTENLVNTSVSLPIYPSLSEKEAVYVGESFKKILVGLG